ncbi:MAG: M48 family metalloprotease [Kiritimatiellae bacterium]|nr:M48 family metalloprotease [Kiritimatiellia bacterium]
MKTNDEHPPVGRMTRREFMALSSLAAAGALTGCATNPVSGKRQLMFFGKSSELEWDQESAPHQFSADYGAVQDAALNAYVAEVGGAITPHAHRPNRPYNYRCVNASYINAYTFPAGSMATTRGILLNLQNEDELAALLGHEIGHVNYRHTAEAMTKNLMITGLVIVAALAVEASTGEEEYTPWITGLGALGSGLLLAKYSRSNEQEADKVGMDYMVKAGYSPEGMVGLMAMLKKLDGEKPWLVFRMFSSHPWGSDRYDDAVKRAGSKYAHLRGQPLRRERYMDMTASVRRAKNVIEEIQKGDDELSDEKLDAALSHYGNALRAGADDYEALLKMANAKLAQEKPSEALNFARKARAVYPAEPQACHMTGMAHLELRRYGEALEQFNEYANLLPGNPLITYYRGRACDGMGRKADAAEFYQQFLNQVEAGEEAEYARKRLTEWGFLEEA